MGCKSASSPSYIALAALPHPKLSCSIHESMSQGPRGVLSLVHRDFQGYRQKDSAKTSSNCARMASTLIRKKLGEAGRRLLRYISASFYCPISTWTTQTSPDRVSKVLIVVGVGWCYEWQLRLKMKSLNWAGRTGHDDKVPDGNRRPVPENSGAQSAFFTCWLGLSA